MCIRVLHVFTCGSKIHAENSQCQDLWRHEVPSYHYPVWKLWYHCRGVLHRAEIDRWESHCDVHEMIPQLLINLFTIFVSNLQVSNAKMRIEFIWSNKMSFSFAYRSQPENPA